MCGTLAFRKKNAFWNHIDHALYTWLLADGRQVGNRLSAGSDALDLVDSVDDNPRPGPSRPVDGLNPQRAAPLQVPIHTPRSENS